MAGKTRNWLERNGRYYARVVIPPHLRPFMNKRSQLTEPLGPDLRVARSLHAAAVERIHAQIDVARQKAQAAGSVRTFPARLLSNDEIAHRHYLQRLALDDGFRKASSGWVAVPVDDLYAAHLREGMIGRLNENSLLDLVG